MKTLFLALLLISTLAASNPYYEHKVSQFRVLPNTQVVMLGDSITDRGLFGELLPQLEISNRGISGDTTQGVLDRLKLFDSHVKELFIMIGINDLLSQKSVKYVYSNYVKILEELKKKNIKVVIESTLYVGKTAPQLYNIRVKELNSLLKKYAQKEDLTFLDLNVALAPNGYLEEKYSLDGLHLNGDAYLIWRDKILSLIEN